MWLHPITSIGVITYLQPIGWHHQMETFSALLALCSWNSPVKGQWRGTVMFSLICAWINGWIKPSWGWWFEPLSRSLWRANYDCNETVIRDTPKCIYYQYSAPPICHGLFSPYYSQETPIAHPLRRGMGVFREILVWQKFCLRILCTLCDIVLDGTAIYRYIIVYTKTDYDSFYPHSVPCSEVTRDWLTVASLMSTTTQADGAASPASQSPGQDSRVWDAGRHRHRLHVVRPA